MTWHAAVEYLKYRWKAKGRHGTHSPFVYDLVEQVLLNKNVISESYRIPFPELPLRYENLLSRIAEHYQYREIIRAKEDRRLDEKGADMILIDEQNAPKWMSVLEQYAGGLKNERMMVVVGIHTTAQHTKMWDKLCQDPSVRMSIDLYGIGLLLFRKEFKVPQRFVLQYQ